MLINSVDIWGFCGLFLVYLECNKNTTADEMNKLMDIEKLLKERAMKNLRQTKITGFFLTGLHSKLTSELYSTV
jgi:hypothetical protein